MPDSTEIIILATVFGPVKQGWSAADSKRAEALDATKGSYVVAFWACIFREGLF